MSTETDHLPSHPTVDIRDQTPITCTIAICVYTADRLAAITSAINATMDQMMAQDSLLVVVDHNPDLAELLSDKYAGTSCRVLESQEPAGLSGARNTAIAASADDVIVFVDDDAIPRPGWLPALRARFAVPTVDIVGGAVEPDWEGGHAPRWFPIEYGWVVGCDYRGMPGDGAAIRNPIGANMAIRRRAFDAAGRFAHSLGRVGTVPAGCEETDMSIRIAQQRPDNTILRDTSAVVDHAVPRHRQSPRYFVRRCFHEGRSKAALKNRVGSKEGLSSERGYVLRTLSSGVFRHLGAVGRFDFAGVARAFMLGLGVMAAAAGYLTAPRQRREKKSDADPFVSIPVIDLDLTQPFPQLRPNSAGQLWVLARAGRQPVATRLVTDLSDDPELKVRDVLAEVVDETFQPLPAVSQRLVTVVICTLGTEPLLRETVRAVLDQTHEYLDVIVVDNDPATGSARALVEDFADPRLRLIDEEFRGVSAARNRGTIAAHGDIVAFTDDDAIPDPEWISQIATTFDRDTDESISCVTGLVTSAEFRTQEQLWFEEYGGFDKGFRPVVWSTHDVPESMAGFGVIGERDWFFPYSFGIFGSGNNMAFRVDRLRELGGFDEALGAGTIARGGEDLDVFRAVIMAGDVLVYNPAAHVQHRHRDTYDALRVQLFGYGVGMAAVIAKELLAGPRRAFALAKRIPVGVWRLLAPSSVKNQGRSPSYPRALVRTEIAGYLAGPWRFLRSRRITRRAGRGRPLSVAPGERERDLAT